MGTLKEKFCQNPKRFFASLLKMLESDTGDCTLVTAEGLDIRCHRVVLLQSPVLRSLISSLSCCRGKCGVQEQLTILLPDVSYRHLDPVVQYLYTGVLTFKDEDKSAIRHLVLHTFKLPGDRRSLAQHPGYVTCPECSARVHVSELLEHMVTEHVRAPCVRDLGLVARGDSRPVSCSQRGPDSSAPCSLDPDLRNGLFNYIGQPDPGAVVVRHYRVHFQAMVDYVAANYSLPADHGALFDPEKWRAEMQSTDSSCPDADTSQFCHDDADNETDAVIIRNQDRHVDISSSPSHSGGLSDNDGEKSKPLKDPYTFKESPIQSVAGPSGSGQSKSQESILSMFPRSNKSSNLSFSKRKRQSCDEDGADEGKMLKSSSGRKRYRSGDKVKCRQCRKCFNGNMFPFHLVTGHLSSLWTEDDIAEGETKCAQCGSQKANRFRLIQHVATTHGDLEKKLAARNESLSDYEITLDTDDLVNDNEDASMETLMSMTQQEQDDVSQEVNGDKEQQEVTPKINDGHDGAPGSLKVRLNIGPKKRGRPRKSSAERTRKMMERSLQLQENQKRSVDAMLKNMQPSKIASPAEKKGAGPGHVGKLPQDVGSTHLVPTSSSGEKNSEENKVKSTPTNRNKKVKEPTLPRKTEKSVPKPPEIIDLEAQLEALSKLSDLTKSDSKTYGVTKTTQRNSSSSKSGSRGSSIKANKKKRFFAETSTLSSSTEAEASVDTIEEVNVSVNDSADSLLKEMSVDANNANLDAGAGGDESDDTLPFSPGEADRDKDLEEEQQDTTNESRDSNGRRSYEVERIVDRKIVSKGGKKVTMYKVRWVGYGPEDDQWLASDRLNCPELVAEFDGAIDTTNEDEET